MDDIQRKLEVIDKQLAGRRDFHKRIFSSCPLVFVAIGLILGILLQNTLGLSIWLWLILLSPCAITAVVLFAIRKDDKLGSCAPMLLCSCALICFACLGAIRLNSHYQPKPNDIRNLVADKQRLATIRGLIVTEPYINRNRDWAFAKFKFTDPASSFYLKVNEVETTAGWTKAAGTVRVYIAEPVLDLKAGDYIQAYCWLDKFKEATNPGQFDIKQYLARKNVFAAASVQSRDGIELLKSSSKGIFTKIKRKLRETATQALLGDLSIENPSRGLLEALLLGYRANIDSDTYRAFRKTGLLHFISLSGMHLGILVGIIWWICKTAGLMKPTRAIICIIAIGIFLLIVPPRAPTLRAAIIGWVFCASFLFRRRFNSLNTLSLAAIILLLIRPTQIFEAGWQLSFAAVLGLLVFTERIENFIYDKTDYWFRIDKPEEVPLATGLAKKLGAKVITLFSVGFAAWLGGAGILLYHFYTITPLASIWTVIAFPLVALILTIGFLKIILSLLLPSATAMLGLIVNGLSDLLIWIVKLLAHLDISQILIGHVPLTLIILYYAFIVFVGFVYFRRPLIKKAICTTALSAVIFFSGAVKWQRTHQENLVVTTLDVGHGQAILAQLPGRANILFDAGSLHKSDVGRRIVAPFLDYSGINRIDAIIISHNDTDHINGIPEILEYCEVNDVYANDAFLSEADQWGTAKFLDESLNEKGLEIQRLNEGLNLSSKAKIKILWPSEQVCKDETLGDNDKSVVSLIAFAGSEILLCSDIEKFAQRELLRVVPNLKAEVVVVPHHGSANTLDPNFLENLEANILIYSCGRRQYEGQQTIKRRNGIKLLYTPKDGAITVCIDKDGTIKIVPRDR